MTSLSTGASRKVPITPRLSTSTTAQTGQPDLRWRAVRNPLGPGLVRPLLAAPRPLTPWPPRLRARHSLPRLPAYLLPPPRPDLAEDRATGVAGKRVAGR